MSKILKRSLTVCVAALMALILGVLCACDGNNDNTAENPIKSITAIGFVDYDGPKLKAMALEYEQDLTGADIDKNT